MTIPDWLTAILIGAAVSVTLNLAYYFGRRHGSAARELPGVEPGWYPPTPPRYDEETARRCHTASTGHVEAPTTKRARPTNPRPPRYIGGDGGES